MARRRVALALTAALCGAGIAALPGCGSKFELPTETVKITALAKNDSYQRIQTWGGMDGISDILLTQGGGTQLFLVFKASATHVPSVVEYPLTRDTPLPYSITDVINPEAVCFQNNHLFVLDQGDTATARTSFPCIYEADCGPMGGFSRPIVDLSRYWRVREYDLNGDTVSTFTDTTLASVNGIAVDSQGRVYVSGVLMFCNVDPFDSRLNTLEYEFRVYRYVRGGPDPDMPGAAWERDRSYVIAQGTGIGSTNDPRQMYWDAYDGAALFFADAGNNEVQKYGDPAGGGVSYKIDVGQFLTPLQAPTDVALDRQGFSYLVDAGGKRVMRYDAAGEFVQRVDVDPGIDSTALVNPVAVAADDSLVYVADRGAGQVLRFKRRK